MGLNGVITKIVQVSDGIPLDSRHPRVLMVEVLTAGGVDKFEITLEAFVQLSKMIGEHLLPG
jgi:hypothetical protein